MYTSIYVIYDNKQLWYNKVFGITYYLNKKRKKNCMMMPNEIQKPYVTHLRTSKIESASISLWIKMYALLLTFLSNRCYPIIYLLSHLRLNLYENAQQASWAFQKITQGKQQKLLCLPRSVFIATTSKRFKEHGTMYIGVFLPSRNMHAWVIEDAMQTDGWDNYWILYQPLIMMRG